MFFKMGQGQINFREIYGVGELWREALILDQYDYPEQFSDQEKFYKLFFPFFKAVDEVSENDHALKEILYEMRKKLLLIIFDMRAKQYYYHKKK